jgi:hypothetical protein
MHVLFASVMACTAIAASVHAAIRLLLRAVLSGSAMFAKRCLQMWLTHTLLCMEMGACSLPAAGALIAGQQISG